MVTSWICTGLRKACLLLLVLGSSLLMGCTTQPTLKDGTVYLQGQVIQAELNSFNTQLSIAQKNLAEVLPEFQEVTPYPPQSRVGDLTAFLENNNCLRPTMSTQDRIYCYQLTRVMLIQTSKTLDDTEVMLWGAKQTIHRLSDNIKAISDLAPKYSNGDLKPP